MAPRLIGRRANAPMPIQWQSAVFGTLSLAYPIAADSPTPPRGHTGALYALLAYGSWGLLPIYWKSLGQVPAAEVICHRIVWSMVFLTVVLGVQGRQKEFWELVRSPQRVGVLLTTALLLSLNWGIYVYGVNTDRVVETSLGYFINPLFSVLLGVVFLKERLNQLQWMAVGLAALGVANFIRVLGQVPWIALALAVTFGLYGLLRKVVAVSPMTGLAVETLLVTPVALVLMGYWAIAGVGHLGTDWRITLLFVGAGVATSFPLLWFNNAARRLRLSTLGFFQYMAPSIQLILGVFLYREPFTPTHAITFGLIWCASILYSMTALMAQGQGVSKS